MKLFLSCVVILFNVSLVLSREVYDINDLNGDYLSITKIDLSNKGLSNFPNDILKCKNLVELDLSNNGIIRIPTGLSDLELLKIIDLSTNQGISIADLELIFTKAKFELTSFSLANCDLLDVPEYLGEQITLINLNLSNNNLKTLPYNYTKLGVLQNVNLSSNYFSDLSWLVKYWWGIKKLNLLNNKKLQSESILLEYSYFDKIDILLLPNLTTFSGISKLTIKDLTVGDGYISNFKLNENSNHIKRLNFINCKFDVDNFDKNSALNKHYQYLSFKWIDELYLSKMNLISADTLSFSECELKKEMFEGLNENIEFIDLRGAKISTKDLDYIKKNYPQTTFISKEGVPFNNSISPPFPNAVEKGKSVKIDSSEPDTLIFNNVVVQVPADAFINVNGRPFDGIVTLTVKEYLTPEDVLFSGIPMTIEENQENFMFSSAGMIDIRATDEQGNELGLRKDIGVRMKSNNGSKDMNLYYLDKDGVWKYKGKDIIETPFIVDKIKVDSVANQDFEKMISENVIYVKSRIIPVVNVEKRYKNAESFTLDFIFLKTTNRMRNDKQSIFIQTSILNNVGYLNKSKLRYYGDSALYYIEKLKEIEQLSRSTYEELYYKESNDYSFQGPSFVSDVSLIPDLEKDVFLLCFDFKNEKLRIPMIIDTKGNNIKGELRHNKRFYDLYKKELRKKEAADRRLYNKVQQLIVLKANRLRINEEKREVARQKLIYDKKYVLQQKASSTSLVRAFTVSNFGVFNCDVKSRMNKPTKLGGKFNNGIDPVRKIINKVIVVDFDKNGVVQFDKSSEAFFDKQSKSAIIVFFTATIIGVYKSWVNIIDKDGVELKMMDTKGMNNATLKALIKD